MAATKTTPKILLQTWKSKIDIPAKMKALREKWLQYTPDYEHPLYDDNDLRNVIVTHFPQYLKHYDDFTQNIERVDFARPALLYVYGGVYADLDTEPLKPIDDWVQKNTIVLGREPLEHARRLYNREVVLCNAFMISPPKQQVWLDYMQYIIDHYEPYYKPVDNTGPMALTKFYEQNPHSFSNVIITDPCVFFSVLSDGSIAQGCKPEDAYIRHIWANSWTVKSPTEWIKTYGMNKRLWVVGLFILFIFLWIWFWAYSPK